MLNAIKSTVIWTIVYCIIYAIVYGIVVIVPDKVAKRRERKYAKMDWSKAFDADEELDF